MIETIIWASVATLAVVLAFIRSKQWSTGSSRDVEALLAEQQKIRDDCTKNFKAIGALVNDLAADLLKVKPILPHYEELLKQFEDVKSSVSSMRTKLASKAVAGL